MTNITLSIPEIHCSSCEALVKLSLKKLPGINTASVNSQTKIANIDYDENLISKEQITNQIQKETGYKVS